MKEVKKDEKNIPMSFPKILRDRTVSLDAIGLYSIMQVQQEPINKSKLAQLSSDSMEVFESAWNELIAKGYLIECNLTNEKGEAYSEYRLTSE